jgi:hypothetical protein
MVLHASSQAIRYFHILAAYWDRRSISVLHSQFVAISDYSLQSISGKYRKAGDGLFCKECPPGQYQEENGQEECNVCPEDFYCPTPTEKVGCPDGAKCPEGSTTPIFCQNLFEYSDSKQVFDYQ